MAEVMIDAADGGRFMAYVALPTRLPAPGLLVIQEIFGVNAVMRELCTLFAAQGYVAMCPDLFWRQTPGINITDKTEAEWAQAFTLYKGFDETKGVTDLVATLAALRKHPACNGRAGSVGYCLGGKLAYLMATRSDSDCSVSYYGVGIEGALGEVDRIRKPLLMHVAARDQFVPPAAQAQIQQAVAKAPTVTLHVYPDVDHAFARVGGAHFNKKAADLANSRTADFFEKHLKTG